MKIVIYVEKSKAAKAIAKALNAGNRTVVKDLTDKKLGILGYWKFDWNGNETYIIYGSGHLAGLYDAVDYDEKYKEWSLTEFPCIPDRYKTKPLSASKDFFNLAQKMFQKAELIISATDPDREGEVVFDYVYSTIGCQKPWKRAWLPSDLTPAKVKDAFQHLEEPSQHYPLRVAGKARSCADWLIGINLTVAATLVFGGNHTVMNVGRVQTAVLNLVVERTRQNENFVSKPFWKVVLNCEKDGKMIEAKLVEPDKFDNLQDANNMLNSCNCNFATVKDIKRSSRTVQKPKLYMTTDLQVAINQKYGYSVEQIAQIMETLYHNGYITYPRTEADVLSTAMMNESRQVIQKLYNTDKYGSYAVPVSDWADFTTRHFNDEAFAKSGDAHTAVVPTLNIPNFDTLSEEEQNVYDMIAKSVLRLPLSDVDISDTSVIFDINGHEFKANGCEVNNYDSSWYSVDNNSVQDALPVFGVGERINCKLSLKEGKTKPDPLYSEGSLIKAMKTAGKKIEDEEIAEFMNKQGCGLGTGGTRPEIIAALKRNKLLTNKSKSIVPTDKGYWLIDHLPDELHILKEAETTGKWEKMLTTIAISDTKTANVLTAKFLNAIRKATVQYFHIISQQPKELYAETDSAKKENGADLVCPKCGKPLRKFDWGYSCTGYKEGCNFSIGKVRNKKLTDIQVRSLLLNGKTGNITFKSKEGKTYKAYLTFDSEYKIEVHYVGISK